MNQEYVPVKNTNAFTTGIKMGIGYMVGKIICDVALLTFANIVKKEAEKQKEKVEALKQEVDEEINKLVENE